MVEAVLLQRDAELGVVAATPKSTKSSGSFGRMLSKKEETKGSTKTKKSNKQPIEVTIRDLADAFAITEENAGIEFFFRIPSQVNRSGLETDAKSKPANDNDTS